MMIHPTDEMRRLSERWLDGLATPAEESELLQLLDAAEELPQDLADQRQLMHALIDAAPEAIGMTKETEAELSAFVSELAAAAGSRDRGKWRLRSVWMRAAAAAVVAILLGATGWGLAEHYGETDMHIASADTATVAPIVITPDGSVVRSTDLTASGEATQPGVAQDDESAMIAKAKEKAAAAAAARERQQRMAAERAIGEAQSVINDLNLSMTSTSRQLESVSERIADRSGILTTDDSSPSPDKEYQTDNHPEI